MKSWWKEKDFLTQIKEKVLTKDMNEDEIATFIFNEVTNFNIN